MQMSSPQITSEHIHTHTHTHTHTQIRTNTTTHRQMGDGQTSSREYLASREGKTRHQCTHPLEERVTVDARWVIAILQRVGFDVVPHKGHDETRSGHRAADEPCHQLGQPEHGRTLVQCDDNSRLSRRDNVTESVQASECDRGCS
jgi:predicted TIM-barrel fold metal-dependent hydrolase